MTNKQHLFLSDGLMRIAESAPDRNTPFEIDLESMSTQFFPGGKLDAYAMEAAIAWTEDRLQRAKFSKPDSANLSTNDAHVRRLCAAAGIETTNGALLHVDAVEQLFSRLVMQAHGQAAGHDALPQSGDFYASVVLVRELMHHLKFPVIELGDGRTL